MSKIIAVDFDGTLCENRWPGIGEPNWGAIHKLREEQANGAKIILWTCREDEMLRDAVSACERWGLNFDAINENLQEQKEKYGNDSRKIGADEYWDDKAVYVAADKPGKQTDIKWSIYEYISPALLRIGAVAAEGLRKYGTDNWYRVSKRDDIEHAIHHLIIALNMLEGYPVPTEEQGDDHLAHAACRVMMAISQEEKENE